MVHSKLDAVEIYTFWFENIFIECSNKMNRISVIPFITMHRNIINITEIVQNKQTK